MEFASEWDIGIKKQVSVSISINSCTTFDLHYEGVTVEGEIVITFMIFVIVVVNERRTVDDIA